MKRLLTSCCLACLISGIGADSPVFAEEANVRVGTYDSRLVATAYVRSDTFRKRLEKMHADLKRAKEAGDEKRVKQLEAEGPALQTLIHKQGFSTWPVHDILAKIEKEMPKIADEAKVDLIVSKWDVVFRRDGVKVTDVTDLIVAQFNPDQETQKVLESLRKKDPVPLDQLSNH